MNFIIFYLVHLDTFFTLLYKILLPKLFQKLMHAYYAQCIVAIIFAINYISC